MYKFLSSVIIITLLSLSYVWQQVKLVEYSYRINNTDKKVCLLIDENERLRYNVASLSSPVNLQKSLIAKRIDMDTQRNWRNIKLAKQQAQTKQETSVRNNPLRVAARAFSDMLTPKREAIAQESK